MEGNSIIENLVGKEALEIGVQMSQHILIYSNKKLATQCLQ